MLHQIIQAPCCSTNVYYMMCNLHYNCFIYSSHGFYLYQLLSEFTMISQKFLQYAFLFHFSYIPILDLLYVVLHRIFPRHKLMLQQLMNELVPNLKYFTYFTPVFIYSLVFYFKYNNLCKIQINFSRDF